MNFIPALQKEIMEQWRTSRFIIIAAVLVGFGMMSPFLARWMPEIMGMVPGAEMFAGLIPAPTTLDAITQFVKNINQFSLLLAVFVPLSAVAQEKERGTAALVLVKPLSRGSFLMAKFSALTISFSASMLLAGLAGWYYTTALFEAVSISAFLLLCLFLLINALVIVAVTLLASTLFRSQGAVAGVSLVFMLLVSLISSLPSLTRYTPTALVNWGISQFSAAVQTEWLSLGISLGFIAVCLISAWLVFRRQEI
ncbi:MAG TPA: ABC transporter permease subunit [Longilinea sp.]|nr:ABC transporter permease subunit [Longilinea sp.]